MKNLFRSILFLAALAISSIAGATSFQDYGENKVIDAVLRGQAIGTPATWYIALYTDTCSDSASGTEVSTSGTAYARQAVTASLANWAGTQSAGSTSASGTERQDSSANSFFTSAWSTTRPASMSAKDLSSWPSNSGSVSGLPIAAFCSSVTFASQASFASFAASFADRYSS